MNLVVILLPHQTSSGSSCKLLSVAFLFSNFILCAINVYEVKGWLGKGNMELKQLQGELIVSCDLFSCLHPGLI